MARQAGVQPIMIFFKTILKKLISKLPDRFQKNIYLAWFNLKKLPSLFEWPMDMTDLIVSPKAQELRLIGFLKIHNEASSGNLERVLRHMKKFCDEIVVCDCQSSDNSVEIARKFTEHILREPNDFKNELFAKQKMLIYTLKLNPDWIVWLDADEVFDRGGELYGIRNLCLEGDKKGIDGFSFLEYNLWRDREHYRVDEFWGKGWYVRLWKNNGALEFEDKLGLHNLQYPKGLKKIKKTNIKVIHYGFSNPKLIEDKYQMYKKLGQSGYLLDRFKNEKNIRLKPFNVCWFPLSILS